MAKEISRTLSYTLRHHPEEFGLTLNEAGWVPVEELLSAFNKAGVSLTLKELEKVVAESEKTRFTIRNGFIRANQGHSIPVNLGLEIKEPPQFLFHGTVERFKQSIKREGLRPMKRHAVHLSESLETATQVGARRKGETIILRVQAKKMFEQGHQFSISENGVWLVSTVPSEFIIFPH